METKSILPADREMQNRVMDAMLERTELSNGVVKIEIPEAFFNGEKTVEVEGRQYGIYEIPGHDGDSGHSFLIEHAIERFIAEDGPPIWSQVTTRVVTEETWNQLVTYPQAVYLRK